MRGSKNVILPFGGGSSDGSARSAASTTQTRSAGAGDPPGDPPAGSQNGSASRTPQNQLSPLGKGGLPGVTTDLYQIGFDSNWELDIFGGTRRRLEAATADLTAAVESRRDVMVTLIDQTACTDLVALYKALGGGWQVSEEISATETKKP